MILVYVLISFTTFCGVLADENSCQTAADTIANAGIETGVAPINTVRKYFCIPTHKPEDPAVSTEITCRESGWDKIKLKCVPKVECPVPSVISGSAVMVKGHLEEDVAVYMCDTNLTPVGNPVIRCLSTGKWEETAFRCKDMSVMSSLGILVLAISAFTVLGRFPVYPNYYS